ncbi:MAG: hypothetical protein QOD06_3195, partial [Candidatus Binatota bacterium]|nr:hypothetical protein [Candidatus Binatota bacterium]
MADGGRRIFVGDVQGCVDELRELLDAVKLDPARDRLHPVGDFVNRGPDSAGVLRVCREIDAGGVLGNHDLHCLKVAAGKSAARPGDTLDDLLAASDRDELLGWLRARPIVRGWPDLITVHAGLHPRWRDPEALLGAKDPLGDDPATDFAVRVRHCDPEGRRPEKDRPPPGPPFRPWDELYEGERTVVFGHWAARGLVWKPKIRGLDTGCVWGGQLTAWIAEEDRL